MEPVLLVRAIGKTGACLMMLGSGAMVHAELRTPLSPRSVLNSQSVNAISPVRGLVELGPYDIEQHRFTDCILDVSLPEASYSRVDYAHRGSQKKEG